MEPMIAYLYVYLDEAVEADTDGTFLKNFPLPNNIFRRLRASVAPWAFVGGFFCGFTDLWSIKLSHPHRTLSETENSILKLQSELFHFIICDLFPDMFWLWRQFSFMPRRTFVKDMSQHCQIAIRHASGLTKTTAGCFEWKHALNQLIKPHCVVAGENLVDYHTVDVDASEGMSSPYLTDGMTGAGEWESPNLH